MQFQIFDNIQECSDDEVARLLPLVSPHRREHAMRYKFEADRFACLKSYVMLQEMVGIVEPLEFGYGEYGKPYLVGHPDIHFNISHCPRAIAVAVSDHPIGIDIECFHVPDDGLIRHTMNEEEIRCITSSSNPAEAFAVLWTQKEAILKCLGTGIIDDLRWVRGTGCTDPSRCLRVSEPVPVTHINRQKQYACSICENF